MAIVRMKRLRLLGLLSDREDLLTKLQRLGCVEVNEPALDPDDPDQRALTRPDGQGLAKAKERSALLSEALRVLDKYAPAKKKLLQARPEVTEQRLFDEEMFRAGLKTARELLELERTLNEHRAERSKLEGKKAALQPWLALDVPLEYSESTGLNALRAVFGAVPVQVSEEMVNEALASAAELYEAFHAGQDRELRYFLLLCHPGAAESCTEALRPLGFTQVNLQGWTGLAVDNDRKLDDRIVELDRKLDADREKLESYGDRRPDLQLALDRASQEEARETAQGRLVDTGETFLLEGWFPAEDETKLRQELDGFTCAYETEEPETEEYPEVPVKLKNGPLVSPLNMVTEMYSLPAYDGLDPNPLMAPFFIFFYGFMMADMGYGLVMMLASAVIMKKAKPKGPTMRYMIPLLGLCGVSTFIMGALTGGFFGDLIPQLVELISGKVISLPALFSPLDDALAVLVGSLVIGLLQIFTGMGISMYKQIKRGETMAALCNEGAWFLVFIFLGLGIWLGQIKAALIAIVVLLVLTQGYGKKGIFGKFFGIFGSLYNNITGYFSDILSYSRLMALMLAGAVIAQVFNTLGAITGNVISFFLISIIGNALNFALNLLGCYVHDMRLQCLEYFSRFYEDGGKPFRPLEYNTKYVDIK